MKTPLIIHDLHDSQMFSIAQAAGRAGIPVEGTFWPVEGWGRKSRYIQRTVELPCLVDQLKGTYAHGLKSSGLSGVWLPCMDDMADFTSQYQELLRNIGMQFLTVDAKTMAWAYAVEPLPEIDSLRTLPLDIIQAGNLYENAENYSFPIMLKSERDRFQKFTDPATLRAFLAQQDVEKHADRLHRVQQFIEGGVDSMASALILFDGDSRPVRGFTCRRYRVAETEFGPFGETTAAKAEWIPALYEGACELLSAMKWKALPRWSASRALMGSGILWK